jgi:pimeloyl-ACP methyl ester carboxylesterase
MATLSRRTMIAMAGMLGGSLAAGARRGVAADQATPPAEAQGRVETEGDELAFDVRGQGQSLLLIPGGTGDARGYALVAERLAPDYTVITYDPRGYGRSTRRDPQNYEVGQQARDAAAVISAAGYDAALIFGSSSGAVIGLEMARTLPQVVAGLVPHEPPVFRVLPEAEQLQTDFAAVYLTAWRESPERAFLQFLQLAGLPVNDGQPLTDEDIARMSQDSATLEGFRGTEAFIRYELLPITNYKPDVQMIVEHGVKVVMGVGEQSLDKIYGRTAPILAEQLACPLVTFPGHHTSYTDAAEIDAWVAALRQALADL